jgi:hypothetical protein
MMTREEIKKLIDEEIDKKLQQYGLVKKEEVEEQKPTEKVSYYNPMYMRDSWYND